jgi:thiol-disulfide isomerase/thioredoxin
MKKSVLMILCVVLAALLIGAGILYNSLSGQVQAGGLAAQPAASEKSEEATASTEAPDYSAPDFTVVDWDGNERKLSEFEGKPVILNFWASWCGPCKSEMPDFDEAYAQYGDQIHFVMVNCTDGGRETVDTAKAFIQEAGYSFPVYFDVNFEASYTYGASSIPLTYFIDAEGNLVTYARGALSADMLRQGIGYIYTEE